MDNQIATSPRQLFEKPEVRERFEKILGKKTQGFIVSVINCINDSEKLQQADKNSILFASANAAVLDLPINPNLGFAYIIPYDKKQKDGTYKTFAQFQMGYKGFIQLAQRSGQFNTINATIVKEGEIINENKLTGEIKFKWESDPVKRSKLKTIGCVAYFRLLNGFTKSLYMTNDQLNTHGVKYSKSFQKGYGLWKDEFEAMAIKTTLKLLISKYAPLSIEMQRATLTDQAVINDFSGNLLDYPDNENVKIDPELNAEVKERQRINDFIENAKNLKDLKQCKEYVDKLSDDDELKLKYSDKLMDLKL